jgi:hypothetical protein
MVSAMAFISSAADALSSVAAALFCTTRSIWLTAWLIGRCPGTAHEWPPAISLTSPATLSAIPATSAKFPSVARTRSAPSVQSG